MAYKKSVRGESNQANEYGSFNHISIFNDGSGKIIVCFFCALVVIGLVWMAITQTMLLESGVLLIFFFFILGSCVVSVCFVIRYVSGTRRQLNSDKAAEKWEQDALYTESLVLLRDPRIRAENAQQVSITHHHPPPHIGEFSSRERQVRSAMPHLDELYRNE